MNLWVTLGNGNKIGRVTTGGTFTEFTIPTAGAAPDGITVGSDGTLWFTEPGVNQLGRITTSGALTEFRLPTANSGPGAIVMGPDGALWFTQSGTNSIGRAWLRCLSPSTLCIDELFGSGNPISLSSLGVLHGGLFWFFAADNPEMMIKVLNACSVNQKFWVFYSAGTNVGLTTTVRDTVSGTVKTYKNPDLTTAAPVQDTAAAPPVQDVNALACQ